MEFHFHTHTRKPPVHYESHSLNMSSFVVQTTTAKNTEPLMSFNQIFGTRSLRGKIESKHREMRMTLPTAPRAFWLDNIQ